MPRSRNGEGYISGAATGCRPTPRCRIEQRTSHRINSLCSSPSKGTKSFAWEHAQQQSVETAAHAAPPTTARCDSIDDRLKLEEADRCGEGSLRRRPIVEKRAESGMLPSLMAGHRPWQSHAPSAGPTARLAPREQVPAERRGTEAHRTAKAPAGAGWVTIRNPLNQARSRLIAYSSRNGRASHRSCRERALPCRPKATLCMSQTCMRETHTCDIDRADIRMQ